MVITHSEEDLILVVDAGGTRTRIGVATREATLIWTRHIDTPRTLIPLIQDTLSATQNLGRVRLGMIGIAGPVWNDTVSLTHGQLSVSTQKLTEAFPHIHWEVRNDLAGEAVYHAHVLSQIRWDALQAYSMIKMDDAEVILLTEECALHTDWILIKPGTGLGVSLITPQEILATELGHLPACLDEAEMKEQKEWEDILSIRGIRERMNREQMGDRAEDFFSMGTPLIQGLRHEWLSLLAEYSILVQRLLVRKGILLAGRILRSIPLQDLIWLGRRIRLRQQEEDLPPACVLLIKVEYAGLRGLAVEGSRMLTQTTIGDHKKNA